MSDTQKVVTSGDQNATKPLIEDVIPMILDGDMANIAIEFCAYLRANKMKPVWAVTNGWKSNYKGKAVCYTRLATRDWAKSKHMKDKYGKHSWVVTLYVQKLKKYEDVIVAEGLQNFIWDNVHECMMCRSPCHGRPPGMDVTLFGKEIKGICWAGRSYGSLIPTKRRLKT